jgi:hypothetical protein
MTTGQWRSGAGGVGCHQEAESGMATGRWRGGTGGVGCHWKAKSGTVTGGRRGEQAVSTGTGGRRDSNSRREAMAVHPVKFSSLTTSIVKSSGF